MISQQRQVPRHALPRICSLDDHATARQPKWPPPTCPPSLSPPAFARPSGGSCPALTTQARALPRVGGHANPSILSKCMIAPHPSSDFPHPCRDEHVTAWRETAAFLSTSGPATMQGLNNAGRRACWIALVKGRCLRHTTTTTTKITATTTAAFPFHPPTPPTTIQGRNAPGRPHPRGHASQRIASNIRQRR